MPQATAARTDTSGSLIIVSIFLEKLADRAEQESDFQVRIGCGQIFEICCADIAEADPILLQSTEMEGRTLRSVRSTSPPPATRSPGVWRRRAKPWNECGSSIRACAS